MGKLPKSMAGFHFPKLFAIEMNNFEPEMILPGLFYLIRSRGRDRGRRSEATDTFGYAQGFAEHPQMEGFDGDVGLRLAHKWSRTSFVSIGARGRGGTKGEQIAYLYPLSFLTYKPAFPAQTSRHRNVPRFLFDLMFRASPGSSWSDPTPGRAQTEPPLAFLIRQAFSRGIELSQGSDLEARYDGHTPLDTEVLASMYYADCFAAVPPHAARNGRLYAPALPGAAVALVRDLQCLVTAYAPRMPTIVLARHLIAVISLELAAYTLRLISATNQLVSTGSAPADMTQEGGCDATHIELYADVTEERLGESRSISGQCVARDLEAIEHFARASLTLRTIDRFVEIQQAQLASRFGERGAAVPVPTARAAWRSLYRDPRGHRIGGGAGN